MASSPLVNVACLQVISFSRLQSREFSEISRLLNACQTNGFFYLDLKDGAPEYLKDWLTALSLAMEFYNEPLDVKLEYYRGDGMSGYKPIGTHTGVIEGTRDGYENLRIAKDELLSDGPTALPKQIRENEELFVRFITTAHSITTMILSALSDFLGLLDEDRFENKHRLNFVSKTEMEFLKYAKQTINDTKVGFGKHTDSNTLSMLLCEQWGLQVLCPEHHRWEDVEPRKGYAVINVGDTLHALSNSQLRSVVHRVQPRREHQDECRFSTGYFLRAENQTLIRNSEGEQQTALQYYERKFQAYRDPHEIQKLSSIITGGMDAWDQSN